MAKKTKKKRSKTIDKPAVTGGRERLKKFLRSSGGIWLGSVLLVAFLLSFNALIAWDKLEIFLGLTAFELIVAAIVIWVILLRQRAE